ncbi:MAG: YbjN domain-containing protein [Propionibacteriales bacterium]|nr:YbjN domain-containing protein [Propionibacteriales bacterium]
MSETKFESFRAHTGHCLELAYEEDHIDVDDDGDWVIGVNGRTVWVRVNEEPYWHVQLFTFAAEGVSHEALGEINQLNAAMCSGTMLLADNGRVIVNHRIHHAGVTPEVLRHTFAAISGYANDCGDMLETVFGSAALEGDEETIMDEPRTTTENITSLPENGIFVFGSNILGEHRGGAARLARKRFGAVWGQGVGHAGQSYAIPTMGGFSEFKRGAKGFIEFAALNPDLDFYLTKVGCGIAGYDETRVAPLFADTPPNVIKPAGW